MQIEFLDAELRTQHAQTCVKRIKTETQAREQTANLIETLPAENPMLFQRKQAQEDII